MIGHAPDASYLKRLLDQIKPIIGKVFFVNTDDKTDCEEVIKASGLPYQIENKTFESRNAFDFSLVRNMALDMAGASEFKWSIWFDCDDTLDDAERIIEQMNKVKGGAFALPYDVNDRTGNLFKIRIVQPSEWKWVNKIHEELVPADSKQDKRQVILFKEIRVTHSPEATKSNHDFHIDLLKEKIKMSPSDYCYLAKEHFNKLDYEAAIGWCRKAIAIHDVSIEIYNLWLMLAISQSQLGNEDGMVESLMSAILERPHRREAYYFLAEYYGKKGGKFVERGFGFITACTAHEDRAEPLTHQVIYKLNSDKLHARYLQKLDRWQEAIECAKKVSEPDDEVRLILSECEQAIASEQNAIDDGSTKS
jgi:tetratricopeptide (TPR) repeat protein